LGETKEKLKSEINDTNRYIYTTLSDPTTRSEEITKVILKKGSATQNQTDLIKNVNLTQTLQQDKNKSEIINRSKIDSGTQETKHTNASDMTTGSGFTTVPDLTAGSDVTTESGFTIASNLTTKSNVTTGSEEFTELFYEEIVDEGSATQNFYGQGSDSDDPDLMTKQNKDVLNLNKTFEARNMFDHTSAPDLETGSGLTTGSSFPTVPDLTAGSAMTTGSGFTTVSDLTIESSVTTGPEEFTESFYKEIVDEGSATQNSYGQGLDLDDPDLMTKQNKEVLNLNKTFEARNMFDHTSAPDLRTGSGFTTGSGSTTVADLTSRLEEFTEPFMKK
jgi:hypothetical protein